MEHTNVDWVLPVELQLMIFSYLPAKALYRCMMVNSSWNKAAKDDSLWKSLFSKHFPEYPPPPLDPFAKMESYFSPPSFVWFSASAKLAKSVGLISWDPAFSDPSFIFSNNKKTINRRVCSGGEPQYPKAISFRPINVQGNSTHAFLLKGLGLIGICCARSKEALFEDFNKASGDDKFLGTYITKRGELRLEATMISTRQNMHYSCSKITRRWKATGPEVTMLPPYENKDDLKGPSEKAGLLCELRINSACIQWHLEGKLVASFQFTKPAMGVSSFYLVYSNDSRTAGVKSIVPPLSTQQEDNNEAEPY